MRYLALFLLLLSPAQVLAKKKIPCMKMSQRGKWSPVKGTTCIQVTVPELREDTKNLLKLKWYQEKFEPGAKASIAAYKKLDEKWKLTQAVWKRESILQDKIIEEYKKQASIWRKSWLKLKKIKTPKPHWSESKVLWLSVGIVVGVGATVAVTAAILTVQK